jgi:hypothetical protein
MDDCLHAVGGTSKAIQIQRDLVTIAYGGWRLTKWLSNAKGVLDAIPPDELAPSMKTIKDASHTSDNYPVSRVLGVKWDTNSDSFVFSLDLHNKIHSSQAQGLTARHVLSTTATIFDPMGILAPVTLAPKLLMQELWRQKLGWDEVVSDEQSTLFSEWLCSLEALKSLVIPRLYRQPGMDDWSVHKGNTMRKIMGITHLSQAMKEVCLEDLSNQTR